MKYGLMMACMMVCALVFGQAKLTVDRTTVQIGDQVKATIQMNPGGAGKWVNIKTIWPDSIKGIEIASGPDTTIAKTYGIAAAWNLSFFDTGYVRIPKIGGGLAA